MATIIGVRRSAVAVAVAVGAAAGIASAAPVYVTNYTTGTVSVVGTGGAASTLATGLLEPEGIAVAPSGAVYVAEHQSGKIDQVSAAGVVTTFTTLVGTPSLAALASDAAGNLYVAGQADGVVREIAPNGVATVYATGLSNLQAVAFGPDRSLYATGAAAGGARVYRILPGGMAFTTTVDATSTLFSGVAVDAAGDVFVSDLTNGTVDRLTGTGTFVPFAAVAGPGGLAFDSAGDLLVTSQGIGGGNDALDAISPAGVVSTVATGFADPIYVATQAAVPEPASLAGGVVGLALLGRRRARR